MEKLKCAFAAALLLVSLSACQTAAPTAPTVVTEFTEATEFTEPQLGETQPRELDELEQKRLGTFEKLLLTLLHDHKLPDGEVIWEDNSFGDMELNTFAIADVDGDREEELIVNFTTAPMAGMRCMVFRYDAQTETMEQELGVFPAVEFYTGGLAKANWSHNQGFAGERIWPYDLLGYNPATQSYHLICSVDAWDKFMAETDFEGNKFPEEADKDQAGFVYLVTTDGETKTLSKTEFEEQWQPQTFGSAQEIPLTQWKLTEENIAKAMRGE